MSLTAEQLHSIITPVKYDDAKLQAITKALNDTFTRYKIDTPLRTCHFLAQVLHESAAFRFSVEIWGNTGVQKRYDTRVDLGNTPGLDGDGFKYRGRGWIQLTGKTNYRAASIEFGQDFINHPELMGREPWDSLAAGWFWSKRKLNAFADADDIITVTKKINGGFNGLSDRKMWLQRAKTVLIPKPA